MRPAGLGQHGHQGVPRLLRGDAGRERVSVQVGLCLLAEAVQLPDVVISQARVQGLELVHGLVRQRVPGPVMEGADNRRPDLPVPGSPHGRRAGGQFREPRAQGLEGCDLPGPDTFPALSVQDLEGLVQGPEPIHHPLRQPGLGLRGGEGVHDLVRVGHVTRRVLIREKARQAQGLLRQDTECGAVDITVLCQRRAAGRRLVPRLQAGRRGCLEHLRRRQDPAVRRRGTHVPPRCALARGPQVPFPGNARRADVDRVQAAEQRQRQAPLPRGDGRHVFIDVAPGDGFEHPGALAVAGSGQRGGQVAAQQRGRGRKAASERPHPVPEHADDRREIAIGIVRHIHRGNRHIHRGNLQAVVKLMHGRTPLTTKLLPLDPGLLKLCHPASAWLRERISRLRAAPAAAVVAAVGVPVAVRRRQVREPTAARTARAGNRTLPARYYRRNLRGGRRRARRGLRGRGLAGLGRSDG